MYSKLSELTAKEMLCKNEKTKKQNKTKKCFHGALDSLFKDKKIPQNSMTVNVLWRKQTRRVIKPIWKSLQWTSYVLILILNSLICMWMYGWHSWLMPSVHYRFTAYTRDCERSAVSTNVRLNICACLCVPVVEYVHTSYIVPPFFGHLAFLKAIDEAQKKLFYPIVLFCCCVPIQQESHIWTPLTPGSVFLFTCVGKGV